MKTFEQLKPQCADAGASYAERKAKRDAEIKSLEEVQTGAEGCSLVYVNFSICPTQNGGVSHWGDRNEQTACGIILQGNEETFDVDMNKYRGK